MLTLYTSPLAVAGASPALRMLPFQVDPLAAAYATGQLIPQAIYPQAGTIGTQALSPQAVLMPQSATDPELQAANSFVQDAAGSVIRRLHEFLQANIKQYTQLADAIPLVQRAAELYEARDFPRAYAQAYQAYRAIGLVRARYPDMPNQ